MDSSQDHARIESIVILRESYLMTIALIVTCLLEFRRPSKIREERVYRSFREVNIGDLRKTIFSQTANERITD